MRGVKDFGGGRARARFSHLQDIITTDDVIDIRKSRSYFL